MKANPSASPPHPHDPIIGLDRSDDKANLFYIDTRCGRRWSQILDTAPEQLHDWLAKLRHDHPKAHVAVCLEQPAINVILFIEDYAWITLYPINPITLQKFREAFVTSRAKDDAKDAQHMAELLLSPTGTGPRIARNTRIQGNAQIPCGRLHTGRMASGRRGLDRLVDPVAAHVPLTPPGDSSEPAGTGREPRRSRLLFQVLWRRPGLILAAACDYDTRNA